MIKHLSAVCLLLFCCLLIQAQNKDDYAIKDPDFLAPASKAKKAGYTKLLNNYPKKDFEPLPAKLIKSKMAGLNAKDIKPSFPADPSTMKGFRERKTGQIILLRLFSPYQADILYLDSNGQLKRRQSNVMQRGER